MRRLSLLRLATAWLPALLVIGWGFFYLRSMASTLLAPGAGLDILYPTPGGNIRLTAESYVIRPVLGFATIVKPKLFDPNGTLLASASLVNVEFPPNTSIASGPFKVKIRDAYGLIQREKSGKLQIQDFLPPPTGKKSQIGFSVSIQSATLLYKDVAQSFSSTVMAKNFEISGTNGDWITRVELNISKLGAISASATKIKDEIHVQAKTSRLELESIIPYLTKFAPKNINKLTENASVSKVVLAGNLNLELNKSSTPIFDSQLSAVLTGARYSKYRVESLITSGKLTQNSYTGSFSALQSGSKAKGSGRVTWANSEVNATADLIASAPSTNSVTALVGLSQLPGNIASPNLSAHLNYSKSAGIQGYGTLKAASFNLHSNPKNKNFPKISASSLVAQFQANQNEVRVIGSANSPDAGKVKIDGTYAIQNRTLQAGTSFSSINLGKLQSDFPTLAPQTVGKLIGTATVVCNLSGPILNPSALFRINGSGTYHEPNFQLEAKQPLILRSIAGLGSYQNNVLKIDRFWVKTQAGEAWAAGLVDIHNQNLNLNLHSRGLDLSQLLADTSGTVLTRGTIKGSFSHPKFTGELEAYNPGYQSEQFSLIKANLTASLDAVSLGNLQVLKGTSFIQGNLSYFIKSKSIGGNLDSKGVVLADWIGDQFGGAVAVHIPIISGTIAHPELTVHVTGTNLLAQKLPISNLSANLVVNGTNLQLANSFLETSGGRVDFSGNYAEKSQNGQLKADIRTINLDKLLPPFLAENQLDVDGILNGSALATISKNKFKNVTSSGTVDAVAFNNASLGNGIWDLNSDGKVAKATFQIGEQLKFLALENGIFNLEKKSFSGSAVVSGFPINDIALVTAPFLKKDQPDLLQNLQATHGTLQLAADFNATEPESSTATPHFNVHLQNLEADDLLYKGVSFGTVTAAGQFDPENYNITSFSYTNGPSVGNLTADYHPNGSVKADGDFSNFDLEKLNGVFPQIPKLTGLGNLTFLISGTAQNPSLRGSFSADKFRAGNVPSIFGLNLDDIEASNGKLSATGSLAYNGFIGDISAEVPYNLQTGLDMNNSLSGKLVLESRPLKDFTPYSTFLDPAKTVGTLQGNLALSGTLKQPLLSGDLAVIAPSVGFQIPSAQPIAVNGKDQKTPKSSPLLTSLKDVNLAAHFENGVLTSKISATSSQTGSLDGNFSASIPDSKDLLAHPQDIKIDTLLQTPLVGVLNLNKFAAKENNSIIQTKANFSGAITLGGTVQKPAIGGDVKIAGLDTAIPSIQPSTGESTTPTIDPQFDLTASLDGPGTVRTSLASINLTGQAKVKGSLSSPRVVSKLIVADGALRLPGGQVKLVPGGTVNGSYLPDATGQPVAHLQVDLVGVTHVTSNIATGTLERYDVSLEISGDLLSPDQVNFTALSDPPDLSQSQIFAILGRTDILTALGSGQSLQSTQQALSGVVVGYALPSLLEPVTRELASGLGLDYINIEYNAFSQTSFVIGKTFGPSLSFVASQQISQPLPGFPTYFDYRLIYRPRLFKGALSKLSFLLGTDQTNPWKIGIQYTIRF